MLIILPESAGKTVGVKAVGKLTDADYETFVPQVEAILAREGKLKLLMDLTEFEGWEWQAAWDDFAFGLKHWNDIEKMAIVGDARWEELTAKIGDKLMSADVKQFPSAEIEAAWTWVKS